MGDRADERGYATEQRDRIADERGRAADERDPDEASTREARERRND